MSHGSRCVPTGLPGKPGRPLRPPGWSVQVVKRQSGKTTRFVSHQENSAKDFTALGEGTDGGRP